MIIEVKPEILFQNFREFVDYISRTYGDKKALGMPISEKNLDEYIWYSYSDIESYAKAISYYLTYELKLRKGDKVALISENMPKWGLCALGIAYNGFVLVPVDSRASSHEMKMILQHSESEVVFISSALLRELESEEDISKMKRLKKIVLIDSHSYTGEKEVTLDKIYEKYRGKELLSYNEISMEDLFEIVYTSGTTGLSKGVMLSHKNILFEVSVLSNLVDIKAWDVLVSILPLNHTYESTCGLYTVLFNGASIVYTPAITPSVVLSIISKCKATKMLVVPLFLEKIVDAILRKIEKSGLVSKLFVRSLIGISKFSNSLTKSNTISKILLGIIRRKSGLNSINLFVSGAAPLPKRVSNFMKLLGFDVIQGYGLTECAPVATLNQSGSKNSISVGKPIPNVEIKINEPNIEGKGEILIKGPNVMKGYYKKQEETNKVIRDGWLHTGDIGYMDEEGYIYITGRIKNIIVTHGGKNVYPEEIEDKLNASPYVLESLVLGRKISDEEIIGEEVFAYIVPDFSYIEFQKESPIHSVDFKEIESIMDSVVKEVNANLPEYKRIKKYKVLTEELPKTSTRKIKRYLFQNQDTM